MSEAKILRMLCIHVDVLLLVRVLLQSEISWDDFMDRRRSLKMNVYSFLIDLITIDGSSSLSLSLFLNLICSKITSRKM